MVIWWPLRTTHLTPSVGCSLSCYWPSSSPRASWWPLPPLTAFTWLSWRGGLNWAHMIGVFWFRRWEVLLCWVLVLRSRVYLGRDLCGRLRFVWQSRWHQSTKRSLCYWSFVSPVQSLHKGPVMRSFGVYRVVNVNSRIVGDLIRLNAHIAHC